MGDLGREVGRTVRPRSRGELLAAGVARRTLAGPPWRQVAHGWHVPAAAARRPAQRVVEAVVVLDGLLRARVLHPRQLVLLEGAGPLRGAAQARLAATLARPGVRSPWETRLRLFARGSSGCPSPS